MKSDKMKIVMKLGGSVITKKDADNFPSDINEIRTRADEFINVDVVERIGREISEALKETTIQLVLVNGAGPFGHYLVRNKQPLQIVHESVKILNERIIKHLNSDLSNGLKIESMAPNETCEWKDERFVSDELWTRGQKAVRSGKILSTYGDILEGYKVISGDDLAVLLAELWHADRIIMVTDVDGVFTKDPKVHRDAKPIKRFDSGMEVQYSGVGIDVTGGMASKVEKLGLAAKHGIKSQIISGLIAGNVKAALVGDERIGTMMKG